MGTNYYIEAESPCEKCGRSFEQKHIGKSSCGWVFRLHVYPDEGINDLADWEKAWAGKVIVDEYGEQITETQMLEIVTKRSMPAESRERPPFTYKSWADFHARNGSVEDGPNNLLRSQIDGQHTIGHGAGTWDLCVGEFS